MLAAVDVGYCDTRARAAVVAFSAWTDSAPTEHRTLDIPEVEPYVSGNFYLRELPCILAVLDELDALPETVIVDGYVWLDHQQRQPGLGGHLYQALGEQVAVVSVAKAPFATAVGAAEVYRGGSVRPLYVTAAGLLQDEAARCVQSMHGEHRIPSLLKHVDRLCRLESSGG